MPVKQKNNDNYSKGDVNTVETGDVGRRQLGHKITICSKAFARTAFENIPNLDFKTERNRAMKTLTLTFAIALFASGAELFATPPTISSGPTITTITNTSASLTVQINPNTNFATAYLVYGPTTNYGNTSMIGSSVSGPPSARAVSFNGTNQNGTVPGFGVYLPTNEVTVEFWQFANVAAQQSTFILNPDNSADRFNAHVPWSDDGIYWDFGNIEGSGRLTTSGGAAVIGSWNHIALVSSVSNNITEIFMNGQLLVWNVAPGSFSQRSGDLLLAGGTVNGYFFNGALAEFRVWNQALSQTTIQSWMNKPLNSNHPAWNNLLGYWPLNEGAGTNLIDQSGKGHTAMLNNTPAWNFLAQTLSISLANLQPGTTYHAKLVATNLSGMTTSPDLTFTTPAYANVTGTLPMLDSGTPVWADFDNDGKLDLLLNGNINTVGATEIWQNLGNGSFAEINNNSLPSVSGAKADVGDLYNSGNIDFVESGFSSHGYLTEIWHNLGGFVFTNVPTGLSGYNDAVAIADLNNDGKKDIVMAGSDSNGAPIVTILQNLGNGAFSTVPNPFSGIEFDQIIAADFNNDGRTDLLLSGYSLSTGQNVLQLWRNEGNFTFVLETNGPAAISNQVVVVGDFDNDGLLDVFIVGATNGLPSDTVAQLWHNNGNFNFTERDIGPMPAIYPMAIAAGDYHNNGFTDVIVMAANQNGDPVNPIMLRNLGGSEFTNENDDFGPFIEGTIAAADFANTGRLGFLFTGLGAGFNPSTGLFQNFALVSNTPPTAPTGLFVASGTPNIVLQWSAATDAQTPSAALTYELRVGTRPSGVDIVSPEADPITGVRRVARPGRLGENLSATLNLQPGIYYWSVQAVDGAFAGSPFAQEEAFEVNAAVELPQITGIAPQPGGNFQLSAFGQAGYSYTLQGSTNLTKWTNLTAVTMSPTGATQYIYTNSSHLTHQFFRLQAL